MKIISLKKIPINTLKRLYLPIYPFTHLHIYPNYGSGCSRVIMCNIKPFFSRFSIIVSRIL